MGAPVTEKTDLVTLAGGLGLGGLVTETVRRIFNRRRDHAETRKIEAEASPEAMLHGRTIALLKELIEAQSARIAEQSRAIAGMNAEIDRMARTIEDLRAHVDTLADELRRNNLPVPARSRRARGAAPEA